MVIYKRGIKFIARLFFIIYVVFWLPEYDIKAAEYMGRNIDGISYSCTAYSYGTRRYYYGTVEFSGDEAIFYMRRGYIALTLDDEEIEDPHSISAYDYKNRVYWELDVDGID
jgi:hypothetical protein